MALPRLALPSPAPGADSAAETPVPSEPSLAAQTLPDTGQPTQYLLRDEGGMVAVYTCGPDGSPTRLARQTDIYVNLLPENDALRVKQGMTVTGDAALQEVLEDLGGELCEMPKAPLLGGLSPQATGGFRLHTKQTPVRIRTGDFFMLLFQPECILLHADHIIVYGLAAADVADLNVVGALCLDDLGQLLGFLVGDIAAGDDGDKAGVLLAHAAGQAVVALVRSVEVATILPFSRAMISPFRIRLPSNSLSRAA